jgi:protein-disulfide isomerase
MIFIRSVQLVLLFVILLTAGCAASNNGLKSDSKSEHTDNSNDIRESSLKIVIYTDFECGACERFNLKVEPKLREFESTGIVKIQIRMLGALSDESMRGAQAALWAGDSGRFLDYHDALFQAFRQSTDNPCTKEKLIDLAGSLGLKKKSLRRCLDSDCKKPELAKNMDMAKIDGVRVLPAVFINGVKIEGFKPLETYIDIINRALAEKSR